MKNTGFVLILVSILLLILLGSGVDNLSPSAGLLEWGSMVFIFGVAIILGFAGVKRMEQ